MNLTLKGSPVNITNATYARTYDTNRIIDDFYRAAQCTIVTVRFIVVVLRIRKIVIKMDYSPLFLKSSTIKRELCERHFGRTQRKEEGESRIEDVFSWVSIFGRLCNQYTRVRTKKRWRRGIRRGAGREGGCGNATTTIGGCERNRGKFIPTEIRRNEVRPRWKRWKDRVLCAV